MEYSLHFQKIIFPYHFEVVISINEKDSFVCASYSTCFLGPENMSHIIRKHLERIYIYTYACIYMIYIHIYIYIYRYIDIYM